MMISNSWIVLCSLAISFCLSSMAGAQDLFLELEGIEIEALEPQLRANQLEIPQGGARSVWLAVLNLESVRRETIATVSLPEGPRLSVLSQETAESSWSARLSDGGSVGIRFSKRSVSGSLRVDDRVFELLTVGEKLFLFELDPDDWDEIAASRSKRKTLKWWSPSRCEDEARTVMAPTEIEIVVYYSAQVGSKYGNVEDHIKELTDAVEGAFKRSKLNVRLNVVVRRWPGGPVDNGGAWGNLEDVVAASRSDSTLLADIADVGILLYESIVTDACGAAHLIPSKEFAWAVVNDNCAYDRAHALAHEIGHVLGGDHQNVKATPKYAHPFLVRDKRTFMISFGSAKPFEFSAPPKLGSITAANNACVARQSAPWLAAYHQ